MQQPHRPLVPTALGFLGRLRRDARGNTLALMAAMLIPLAAFSGAAIDMGRLYAVKSRLQQACDAGVLAGAKTMTGGTTDLSTTGPATLFFKSNFQTSWFQTVTTAGTNGSSAAVFTPSVDPSTNHVVGNASVNVPMTIMKMFGQSTKTITVACEAQNDGDVDIMLVLDTTGSMGCLPSDSYNACNSYAGSKFDTNSDGSISVTENTASPGSRLDAVRTALAGPLVNNKPVSFFDVLMANADKQTAFRFGFVPFSATVNVGKLLQPLGYVASQWSYWTRKQVGSNWIYKQYVGEDTSQYILGNAIDNPAQGGSTTSTWKGCIEERYTPPGATIDSTKPTLDIDVDTAPTPGNLNSYWGPSWPDRIFWSNTPASSESSPVNTSPDRDIYYRNYTGNYSNDVNQRYGRMLNHLPCPLAASRLSSMTLPGGSDNNARAALKTTIQNYLKASNGFRPYGNTYLDTGMTWGTRLISPLGIFANDTKPWPGHTGINRYIIFLTDGYMETDCDSYSSYGWERFDKRVLGSTCTAIGPSGSSALDNAHWARFNAACDIAKKHNITVFVILFGQSQTSLPSQFTNCATAGQAFYASDQATLTAKFQQIAGQIALLRLSK